MRSRQEKPTSDPQPGLTRSLGLKEATALNMIDMVGIGPFIVIPLVVGTMGGTQAIAAWMCGALLAFIDGCVWSELGAAMPFAGGSYVFLRETYGPRRWGKLMSFLFIWQTLFQAPLVIASGAIGFAQYLTYLLPLTILEQKTVSGLLVGLLVILLYRRVGTIGKVSLFLWIGVVSTFIWLIGSGMTHFQAALAFSDSGHAWSFSWPFALLLGQATVHTMYTYLGYYNVCHLGGEVREPEKTIPRSIFISIGGIAVLYLALQMSIYGVIPWREIAASPFIVSTFMERLYGHQAGMLATILILWIAFASLFSALLGYSRIPYAAAIDGAFFEVFGRLHPSKRFPHISLLVVGGAALLFSLFFKLADAIKAILALRILVQFIGQSVGVMIFRKRKPAAALPFKMWWYPVPAVLACAAWGAIFLSTGMKFIVGGIAVAGIGSLLFFMRAYLKHSWPYEALRETR